MLENIEIYAEISEGNNFAPRSEELKYHMDVRRVVLSEAKSPHSPKIHDRRGDSQVEGAPISGRRLCYAVANFLSSLFLGNQERVQQHLMWLEWTSFACH